MNHIFISYSRKDQDYARKLAEHLRQHGFDVWIDDRIDYGDRWWKTIVKAIEQCAAFVVIMTPDSENSEWVEREILLAQRDQKPIFPVLLKGREFPLLITTQFADVRDGSLPKADFYQRLSRVLPPQETSGVFVAPQDTKTPPINPRPLWIYGAALLVLVAVIGVVLAVVLRDGDDKQTGEKIDESTEVGEIVSETPEPNSIPTNTATSTSTRTPTEIPQPTPTVTDTATLTPSDTPQPTVEPTLAPGTVRVDEKGISQVWVPAGCFMMGSDPALDPYAQSDEQPQHEVCLTEGYWIDQYEVTNAAFEAFIEDGGYENPDYWSEAGWQWKEANDISSPDCLNDSRFNAPQQPVVCVSWYEAEAYARWRGGSLPTEAQWEYAARGTDGRIYPWGNGFDGTRLNFCDKNCGQEWRDESYDDGYFYAAPVGSYEAGKSWVGAYDMAGNVWEWVADWYSEDYYTVSPRENPAGPESGDWRVFRGGSWGHALDYARVSSRIATTSRSAGTTSLVFGVCLSLFIVNLNSGNSAL